MAVIKCKMCGGDIDVSDDKTFGVCEYCGSSMTLPKVDTEQRQDAFNRGNYFRRIGEFDKALAVYEQIIEENASDAEAHWCCALCRFGIEYVEDPNTYEWLPTCHRASLDSFLEDVDYLDALKYSDGITRRQYQKDATKIADVQKGILATSYKEEPFDVFICYKESDENGQRTIDSTLAQDIYYQLTDKGWRVFFSRITLEDKGGSEYEPYIFAALNSAKVMVAVGTKPEHFDAVWVKNEWSRFISMMKKDHTKLLLPCYRDMNPYDLPEQLSVLQSYDMSKIGFIQDLIRGIDKVLNAGKSLEVKETKEEIKEEVKKETETDAKKGISGTTDFIKRGNIALEDGDRQKAIGYFNRALDVDIECAEAYLGKLLADATLGEEKLTVTNLDQYRESLLESFDSVPTTEIEVEVVGHKEREEKLVTDNIITEYLKADAIRKIFGFNFKCYKSADNLEKQSNIILQNLEENMNFIRAEKFADDELKGKINKFKRELNNDIDDILREARRRDENVEKNVRDRYEQTFKGWEGQIKQMRLKAERSRDMYYQGGIELFNEKKYDRALLRFKSEGLIEYKDSQYYVSQIENYLDNEKKIQEEENASKRTIEEKRRKKKKKIIAIIGCIVIVIVLIILIVLRLIIPSIKYKHAVDIYNDGDYRTAAILFGELGDYSDAKQQSLDLWSVSTQIETISCGSYYSVGVKSDCTVVAVGDNGYRQCNVSDWKDIVAVSTGYDFTIGLKLDGTVVATGNNGYGQCNVSNWKNIVSIGAGKNHTVGLKSDGTVVAEGYNYYGQCDVSDWENIVSICVGENHTVGLKSDGTVVAVGINKYGQCDVSDWEDIVSISAGKSHTVGLKSDGTIVSVGSNEYYQCDLYECEDVVAISAGENHTVVLKSDGSVIAVGINDYDQCEVYDWEDIVAVSAGCSHTIGLKSDGTVVAVGYNSYGQCDVSDWDDIKTQE